MKKFFAGIAAAAIITVPMTSFALESMSKGALKKATGQAGVSIALDNVVIYMKSQPTTTYWDADGMSAYQTGSKTHTTVGTVKNAGIEISYDDAAQKLITLSAILDATTYGVSDLTGEFGIFKDAKNIGIIDASNITSAIDVTTGDVMDELASALPAPGNAGNANTANGNFMSGISPLTIDVGTCQALSQGFAYNQAYMKAFVANATAATPGTTTAAYTTAKNDYNTVYTANKDIVDNPATADVNEYTVAQGKIKDAAKAVNDVAIITAGQTNDGINIAANIAGVVIGLPTLEISQYHTKDKKYIKLVTADVTTAESGAANKGAEFIAIEKSG